MTTTIDGGSNGATVPVCDDSKYVAHNLIMRLSASMTLKAVLKLGIPDILATAEGNRPLSAAEILAQLPTKSAPGPSTIRNLRRLLNPLVTEGVFSESLNSKKEPVYGLTEVSKWYVKGNEKNMLSTADLQWSRPTLAAWDKVYEVILDDNTTPFEKGNGVSAYEYASKIDPAHGAFFQGSMISYSWFQQREILDSLRQSGAIDGVATLVDVGGCRGAVIGEIVAQYPHIQGVNFDLPFVIATAPSMKGVQHVGGSFMEGVPSGDAMFLKSILHNHGDEDAIRILQNCFKALPNKGKVIVAEYIRNEQDQSDFGKFVGVLDVMMLMALKGARERTTEEYQELLKAAGFLRFNVIQNPGAVALIVAYKE